MPFSQKLQMRLNPNQTGMFIVWSSTKFRFFVPMRKMFQNAKVDRNSKMTTTAGHSFYIGPIGSFYNQVNDTGS